MIISKVNPQFIVITGGPGSGKTTLLNDLQDKGYPVIPEIARQIIREQIDSNGSALPWKDRELYKDIMFDRSIRSYRETESRLGENPLVFFDRGFLDTLGYAELIGSGIDARMAEYARKWRYNSKVFLLPPWKQIFTKDKERRQDWLEAEHTYYQLAKTYRNYGYNTVDVPKVPVKERSRFVLAHNIPDGLNL